MNAADVAPIPLDRAALEREIVRVLRLLHERGEVFEIRAPKVPRRGTVSGYYDDPIRAARDIMTQLERQAPLIYITLNSVRPELLARAANRLRDHADTTTSDSEIVTRTRLAFDFDPQRPAGISSTDIEHAAAIERAAAAAAYLAGWGWPEPITADSGNGAHLIYRIDLPNDQESRALIDRVLRGVAAFMDDHGGTSPCIRIDTTMSNASRIVKLYGTVARKGDPIPDRPHRRSRLLTIPDVLRVVTREQLGELADELYPLDASASSRPLGKTTSTSTPARHIADAGAYLAQHGIEVASERDTGQARVYVLRACVWNPDHTDHSAFVIQHGDGTIAAGCSHNSCRGRHLADFRDAIEPGWRNANASNFPIREVTSTSMAASRTRDGKVQEFPLLGADGRNHADDHNHASGTSMGELEPGSLTRRGKNGEFPLLSLDDLKLVGTSKPEALVPGKIMKRSLVITYGDGETGKSYYVQHVCFELASQGIPVWYVAAEGFDGILMRILAWLGQHPGKSVAALRVIPMPVQIFKGGDKYALADQASALPEEQRPQMIVLDTLHRCAVGARENDNGDMACVAETAALWRSEFGATTWVIHHEGKGAGNGMRGASCLYDDPDSVQYIFRGGDISVIECEKQKDGIPRFEPEAFTLEAHSLDEWGYPGLRAGVLKSLTSDQIAEARVLWSADQRRKMSKNSLGDGREDAERLSGKLETALAELERLYAEHPDGVFKSDWRKACIDAGIPSGSFDWTTKELQRRNKVIIPDTTGRFRPVK